MEELDLKKQLNKEIESVEISDRVLNNLLLKMREEKSKVVEKKRPWYAIPKRFQSAVAVCGIALLMIIALPLAMGGNGDDNVLRSQDGFQVETQNFAQSKSVNVVELPFKELEERMPKGIAIPKGDSEANMTAYIMMGHSNTINGANVGYEYQDDKYIMVEMQIGGSDPTEYFDGQEEVTIGGAKVIKDAYRNNAGTYLFTLRETNYYVSYVNITDIAKVEKIIEELVLTHKVI